MDNLAEKESIMIGPPAGGGGGQAWHHCTGSTKDQRHNSWKVVPTIISDQDSDPIGVRIPESQDVREEKAQHKSLKWHCKLLGKWTMGAGFWSNSSPLNQGEDKEVSGELNGNSPRLPKDGFPPLSEQGDNICQINWYKEVCSRKTYTIKHWLKGAREIWA